MTRFEKLYNEMCAECPQENFCHEECVECDEFIDRAKEIINTIQSNEIILGEDIGEEVVESKCETCNNLTYVEEMYCKDCPHFNVHYDDVIACGRYERC